jgi:hypothetical protein
MTLLKAILAGLVYWFATGMGFAVVIGAWSWFRTGHLWEEGFILPGGGLGGFLVGFLMGLIIGGFSSLVFVGMCWLRPWALLRLSAIAPVWGLLVGIMALAAIRWSHPANTHPPAKRFRWLSWILAPLPMVLWWIPWLWERPVG